MRPLIKDDDDDDDDNEADNDEEEDEEEEKSENGKLLEREFARFDWVPVLVLFTLYIKNTFSGEVSGSLLTLLESF